MRRYTPDSHQRRSCENVGYFFIFYGHYHYLRGWQLPLPTLLASNEAAFPFPLPLPMCMYVYKDGYHTIPCHTVLSMCSSKRSATL